MLISKKTKRKEESFVKTFIVKSESFIEQELVDAKEILDYDGDLILR